MPRLPPSFLRAAYVAHAAISAAERRVYRALRVHKPLRILPHRSHGTHAEARISGRVIEDRGSVEPSLERGFWRAAYATMKRFDTVEIGGATVRVRWPRKGEAAPIEAEGASDAEGFFEIPIRPPPDLNAGWHSVSVEITAPEEGRPMPRVDAPVLLVDEGARFGVISDIDDTVIDTHVVHRPTRAYALFLAEAKRRRPFPGIPELYRALAGGAGGPPNPIFYVSSSPWNLYDHLDHFLEVYGLPPGPLLLRDWGLSEDGFAPDGRHVHKLQKMESILSAYPKLPFLLLGDSAQHDPEHYLDIVRAHGDRILAVIIRQVPSRPGRLEALPALAEETRALGSEMLFAANTQEIEAQLVARKLV